MDMFQEIFDKVKKADGILLGSPVYLANVSANMQEPLEQAADVEKDQESLDIMADPGKNMAFILKAL